MEMIPPIVLLIFGCTNGYFLTLVGGRNLSWKVTSRLYERRGAIEALLRFKAFCNSAASISNLVLNHLMLGSFSEDFCFTIKARTRFV